jgi:hypothetical protein
VRVIVIDAGHGGKDPGCNYNGVKEKDVVFLNRPYMIKPNHDEWGFSINNVAKQLRLLA